ncbi:MAG: cell surface protein [Verrucomicrobia bacterium]|nr:cell surface protein [Verrucomicrobiota bacterium]
MAIDSVTSARIYAQPLEIELTGVATSLGSPRLWVTCAGSRNSVVVLDGRTGLAQAHWPAGHGVCSPVIAPKTGRLYVCNRFDGEVQAFDRDTGSDLGRVRVGREPVAAALTPDEQLLVVANLPPSGRSNGNFVACDVAIVDTRSFSVRTNISLVNGGVRSQGVAISPDGRWVVVTHNLARFQVPTTQVEHGWMNDAAISLIDLRSLSLRATILLDEGRQGAANPGAVSWSDDGQWLVIAHAGSQELSVIETQKLLGRLLARSPQPFTSDFAFLEGLRRRIPLRVNGPRAVVVDGETVWVAGYFSDTLERLELDGRAPGDLVRLGAGAEITEAGRGEQLFNDATIGHKSWQSCASCHPDGRVDGLNWDLLNDGIGNPKNTKSLLLSHRTPPSMSLGVRGTAEKAVRSGLRNILFSRRNEAQAQAIDEYLKSLEPAPNPNLVNGQLSAAAERGRKLFESPEVGCAQCHPAPLFTDTRAYAVGTEQRPKRRELEFDTPTLVECWRTAPYLHDGSALTVHEVLTGRNQDDRHGQTSHLTPEQIDELAAYVLSL